MDSQAARRAISALLRAISAADLARSALVRSTHGEQARAVKTGWPVNGESIEMASNSCPQTVQVRRTVGRGCVSGSMVGVIGCQNAASSGLLGKGSLRRPWEDRLETSALRCCADAQDDVR